MATLIFIGGNYRNVFETARSLVNGASWGRGAEGGVCILSFPGIIAGKGS